MSDTSVRATWQRSRDAGTPIREYWRLFSPLLKSSARDLVLGMTGLIVSSLLLIKASMILGQICASLGVGVTLNGAFNRLMFLFVALEAGSVLAQYLGRIRLASGTNRVLLDLRISLFRKLSELPMSYFDTQPMGRIITRLTNDVEGVEGFFGGGLARIATACVQIAFVLIGIITMAPLYGSVVAAAAIPSLGFSWFTRKPIRYWLTENKSRNAHVNSTLAEFIQGLPVLRVLGLEAWSGAEFAREARRHLDSSIKVLSWNSFIRPVTVFLSVMPTLTAVILGGWLLIHQQADLAVIVAIIRLTERFSSPVRVLTQEIQVIQDAAASAARVGEMLAVDGERPHSVSPQDMDAAPVAGQIEFADVYLAYQPGRDVVKGLNLTIPAGQKLGIIGATGAGKSSILNLIPGLYKARSGRILIDGKDLTDWDLSALRSQIGYLAQDPFLFQGTLAANILGVQCERDPAARRKFMDLMSQVGLREVLGRFDGGLDMVIREGGSNLSSGEKQMVAFLRLIYEDRPVILMDEATSCMDAAWESAMQTAIMALMKMRRRTLIVIAHRLDTLKSCDRVVRIDHGRIVADGTADFCLGFNT